MGLIVTLYCPDDQIVGVMFKVLTLTLCESKPAESSEFLEPAAELLSEPRNEFVNLGSVRCWLPIG